jgi:integrase/recombinase XerC
MRLARAIDRFLEQMQLENDWTPRTLDSYYRVLVKLPDSLGDETRLADLDGRPGKEQVRTVIARRWGSTSGGRRANVISIFHSFFAWAEDEGLIDDDRVREIKRPPRRRADVYRPGPAELELGYRSAGLFERAAWSLMADRGFRASTVVALRWADVDLGREIVRTQVKGGHRDWVPLGPVCAARLRHVYQQLAPDPDDHLFTVERVEFHGPGAHRVRRDPAHAATTKALWAMVRRVCRRAGIRPLGPHALRHGFATRFLRESQRDDVALQGLLGHASRSTTQGYVDDLNLAELADALARAAHARAQASPDETTDTDEAADAAQTGEWPREGSNLRTRIRSPPLCPLSYGAVPPSVPAAEAPVRAGLSSGASAVAVAQR